MPLQARIVERDRRTVIELDDVAVATADSEPEAIGMLCSEAARVGTAVVVEVQTSKVTRHLSIDSAGQATWSAGPIPLDPAASPPTRQTRVPVVAATPAHFLNYAMTSAALPPGAEGAHPATSAPTPQGGRPLRRVLVLVAAAVVLAGGAFTAYAGAGGASTTREQTQALRELPTAPLPDPHMAEQVPQTLTTTDVQAHLAREAARRQVTVSGLRAGDVDTATWPSGFGDARVTTVTVTATLSGSPAELDGLLRALETGAPALTIQAADYTVLAASRVSVEVTLAGHAATSR